MQCLLLECDAILYSILGGGHYYVKNLVLHYTLSETAIIAFDDKVGFTKFDLLWFHVSWNNTIYGATLNRINSVATKT